MTAAPRLYIHHCTSRAAHFFGREAELALLDAAVGKLGPSVIALVGPGGQGKTAIVQQWLERCSGMPLARVFLWRFYRAQDADLCLRELYGHVTGASAEVAVSASYAVDQLLPRLRAEPSA